MPLIALHDAIHLTNLSHKCIYPPPTTLPSLPLEISTYRASGIAHAVVIESLHDGTVLLKVETIELVLIVVAVLGCDIADKVDIFVRVESCQVLLSGIVLMQLGVLHILG